MGTLLHFFNRKVETPEGEVLDIGVMLVLFLSSIKGQSYVNCFVDSS